jgi:hypothetical protein
VLDLWAFDLVGRLNGSYAAITEPWWYYLGMLPGALAPWTPLAVIGTVVSVQQIKQAPSDTVRFLLCWAFLPIVVLSLPSGKHHHYLVQCLAPWAILAAIGIQWVWIRMPAWRPRAAIAGRCALTGIVVFYMAFHSLYLPASDQCVDDTMFLRSIPDVRRPGVPLVANADLQSMDLFRNLFYLDSDTQTVHNLSYLDDEQFDVPAVYVLTRAKDQSRLEAFGDVTLVLQSKRSRRETGPQDRLSLFHLRYRSDLERRSHSTAITPMQVMGR